MQDSDLFTVKNKKYILNKNGEDLLNKLYESNVSIENMAKAFKVSKDTINRWIKERCLPKRYKYTINENYFETIDSPEKAYWLGFISADGYLNESRGELQLELQEQDYNHVVKFKEAVSSNKPINKIICGINNDKIHYRFIIKRRKISNDLIKYGVVQNKSLTFCPKNIPSNLFKYWILGYMDGDGCVFKARKRYKISFTGTHATLSIIKKFFNSNNKIALEHRCENTYKFTLEVDKSEKFLLDTDYYNLPFCLERKKCIIAPLYSNI